jgi:antitoxin component of MazEF toxin-antitoxin module
VITPLESPKRYDLDALVKGITADNLHGETSTGSAVGDETP